MIGIERGRVSEREIDPAGQPHLTCDWRARCLPPERKGKAWPVASLRSILLLLNACGYDALRPRGTLGSPVGTSSLDPDGQPHLTCDPNIERIDRERETVVYSDLD